MTAVMLHCVFALLLLKLEFGFAAQISPTATVSFLPIGNSLFILPCVPAC
jgi:hypothetical protein